MTPAPFHLSFAVPDLRAAARFYEDALGCTRGRDEGRWQDLLLYGHQLTLHQATPRRPAHPLDHFGVVLDAPQWLALVERLQGAGVVFELPPQVIEPGTAHERGKCVLRDPAGNRLEFKYRAVAED